MTSKCLRYTQLPVETILLYSRVNSFMTCKNLTSDDLFSLSFYWSKTIERVKGRERITT